MCKASFLFLGYFLACGLTALRIPPPDWEDAVAKADMLFSPDLDGVRPDLYPSVGNGFMATVVDSAILYVGGVFNGPLRSESNPTHRAIVPSPLNVTALGIDRQLTFVGLALDLSHGQVIKRYVVPEVNATVELRFFAHQILRNIAAVEVVIERPVGGDSVSIVVSQDLNMSSSPDISFTRNEAKSLPPGAIAWVGTTATPEISGSDVVEVAVVTADIPAGGRVLELPANSSSRTWTFATAIHSSIEDPSSSTLPAAIASYELAQTLVGLDTLSTTHRDAWAKEIWKWRGIEVGVDTENSLELARAINSSLYYITSFHRPDHPWGLSPGGLASNAYNGHVFWDQESWMYPPVLLFDPDGARGLLEYRYNHIAGAHAKAHNASFYPPNGYQGTMFPWESAFSGEEATPLKASTGRYEQHVTGDIAIAIQQLLYATHDDEWAMSRAVPMMEGIGTFWASRARLLGNHAAGSDGDNIWVIENVTPPDEYSVNVNNSAYTNAVAAMSLEFACELLGSVQGKKGNHTKAQLDQWQGIARGLRASIPYDEGVGITLEYDNYSGQTIKQADVALLMFPLNFIQNDTMSKLNLDYYSNKTDKNGPAMTWGAYSVGYLWLNDQVRAASFFARAYANSKAPFHVWTEEPDGGGATNFVTGAGGFLGAIGYGFGGIRYTQDAMYLQPRVPPGGTRLKLRGIAYRGHLLDVLRLGGGGGGGGAGANFTVTLVKRGTSDDLNLKISTTEGKYIQVLEKVGQVASMPADAPAVIRAC